MKKDMKKIALFYFLTAALVLYSCKNLLEEDPKSIIAADKFYKTEDDAKAANAISSTLRTPFLYNLRYFVHTTPLEDYASGQGFYIPLSKYQIPPPMMVVTEGIWTGFYKTIDEANRVLKYVPPISMDEKTKTQLLGEAFFYRAFSYFHLVKNFGGVPIRTEPALTIDA